jgi:hypothetical protein
MTMKKAQIVGQIFIYIMAVIVIGAIVLMGYWAVKNTVSKACQVELIAFKTELERLIIKGTSFGSLNNEVLKVPCNYDRVYFVDSGWIGQSPPPNTFCDGNRIVRQGIRFGRDDVFLGNNVKVTPIISSGKISAMRGCARINSTNGNFYITFSGNGINSTIMPTPR